VKLSLEHLAQRGNSAFCFFTALLAIVVVASRTLTGAEEQSQTAKTVDSATPGKFSDATQLLGVNFQHQASHTSRKYSPETMGSGAALLRRKQAVPQQWRRNIFRRNRESRGWR
jgi:hypothetical protein